MSPRYRPFGAFRFALAMMVLLQHALMLLPAGRGRDVFYDLELGAVAVAVFFALSGFIVAEATSSFYAGRPAAFLANRCLRVVPPYLAALALAVLLAGILYRTGSFVALDAPLAGPPWQGRVLLAALLEIVPGLPSWRISGQDFSFIPFAWTLRVEFAFYLLACAACWLWARRLGDGARRRAGGWMFAAGAAIFCVFLVRHARYGAAGGGLQLLNIAFFGFGVCVFNLQRSRGLAARLQCGLAGLAVPIAFVLCGERGHPVLAFQLPMLMLLLAIFVWLAKARDPGPGWRAWDKRLGELSYPVYIGHGVALTLVAGAWRVRGAEAYAIAVIVAIMLAIALHAGIEIPLRRVRTRIRGAQV